MWNKRNPIIANPISISNKKLENTSKAAVRKKNQEKSNIVNKRVVQLSF